MRYLLDVNVLVAWGWADHLDHSRVARWIAQTRGRPDTVIFTAPIPQIGFIRVSVQRSRGILTVPEACKTLVGMLARLGPTHVFLADDQATTRPPPWCAGFSQTTDAHLIGLAAAHHAELASLDKGIPGAFLIP